MKIGDTVVLVGGARGTFEGERDNIFLLHLEGKYQRITGAFIDWPATEAANDQAQAGE